MNTSFRESASDITGDPTANIAHAAIKDDLIALAVHCQSGFSIWILTTDGSEVSKKATYQVNGEVTCIALGMVAGQVSAFVGTLQAQSIILTIHVIDKSEAPAVTLQPIRLNSGT